MDSQQIQPGLSTENAKAALGLGNSFLQELLGGNPNQAPQQPKDASQSPQNAPESTQLTQESNPTAPDQNEAKFKELEGKMDQMKVEMETMMQKEISGIKDIIIEALQEDKQEDGQKS